MDILTTLLLLLDRLLFLVGSRNEVILFRATPALDHRYLCRGSKMSPPTAFKGISNWTNQMIQL